MRGMPRLAIATCLNIPEPDVDQELMLDAFRAAGFEVDLCAWEDPRIEWSRYNAVLIRSTWNYYENEAQFRDWIRTVATQSLLLNSADLVLPNIDKRYLLNFELAGIPIVPTHFDVSGPIEKLGLPDLVIKPTVSAGSFMTRRFRGEFESADAFLAELETTHSAMVQPFIQSVSDGGEVSLIHIDGVLTHSIVKQPRFAGHEESVSVLDQISHAQRELAVRVLEQVKGDWLYARVDVMRDAEGRWMLSELELIEPSLFLLQHPPALTRLVAGVAARVA